MSSISFFKNVYILVFFVLVCIPFVSAKIVIVDASVQSPALPSTAVYNKTYESTFNNSYLTTPPNLSGYLNTTTTFPTTTLLGGVYNLSCTVARFASGINGTGALVCTEAWVFNASYTLYGQAFNASYLTTTTFPTTTTLGGVLNLSCTGTEVVVGMNGTGALRCVQNAYNGTYESTFNNSYNLILTNPNVYNRTYESTFNGSYVDTTGQLQQAVGKNWTTSTLFSDVVNFTKSLFPTASGSVSVGSASLNYSAGWFETINILNQIVTGQLADRIITTVKLAVQSVTSDILAPSSVNTSHLQGFAVNRSHILSVNCSAIFNDASGTNTDPCNLNTFNTTYNFNHTQNVFNNPYANWTAVYNRTYDSTFNESYVTSPPDLSSYANQSFPAPLVWLPMTDNGSSADGQTTLDFSGFAGDGTLGNTFRNDSQEPLFQSVNCPGGGSCYRFDNEDFINLSRKPQFNFSSSFAVEAWVNFSSFCSTVIGRAASTENGAFLLHGAGTTLSILECSGGSGLDEGRFEFDIVNQSGKFVQTFSYPVFAHRAYHVVAAYNLSHALIYVNGTLVNSTHYPGFGFVQYNTTEGITVGGLGSGTMNGTIGQVRLYNQSLTAVQVAELYVRRASAQYPQGVGAESLTARIMRVLEVFVDRLTARVGTITSLNTTFVVVQANTSRTACSVGYEGGIYYDGATKKHYGCDGTGWNALY